MNTRISLSEIGRLAIVSHISTDSYCSTAEYIAGADLDNDPTATMKLNDAYERSSRDAGKLADAIRLYQLNPEPSATPADSEAESLLREAANAINSLGTDAVLNLQPRPFMELWERIAAFLSSQNINRN